MDRAGKHVQSTGAKVSAIGHTVLIGWLILGWGLDSEPLDFEITPVSVVSGEEYAQMVAATTPQPGTDQPEAPAAPAEEASPPAPVEEAAPVETPPPAPAEQPAEETPPPAPPTPPVPPAEVSDSAPVEPVPPSPVEAALPELTESPRPQPRPAQRIAPEAVAPPPPEAVIAETVQEAVVPDETVAAEVAEPAIEATAPEETATEIAIADEVPSGAPTSSPRPASRPNRPTPAAEPAPQTPAETTTASSDNAATDTAAADAAVEAALADALAAASSPNVAAGPPMSGSEKEGFRVAVNACWNVDPGSQAARVTMTVAFKLLPDGRVDGDVQQVSATGGDAGATEIAFQAARRAILRCQSGGYKLPADKYDQWKEVEITFDPSGMRLR